MRTARSEHLLSRLACGALTCSLAGCGETPTQILVQVDGNLSASQIARIDFGLTRDGSAEQKQWSCLPGFPYSFAANPVSGRSGGTLLLQGTAISPAGEVLLEAKAQGTFQKNRLLRLPIRFDSECLGVACPEGESCVAGSCAALGAAPLSELDTSPKLEATNQCGNFEYLGRGGGAGEGGGGRGGEGGGGGSEGGTGSEGGSAGTSGAAGGGGVPGGTGGGGAGGMGGSVHKEDGDEIFFEGFEDPDDPFAAWDQAPLTDSAVCDDPTATHTESSTERAFSGKRSLKITLETAGADSGGVIFNLVRRIPKDAAYYSAQYYVEGDPVRDPIYGWFAIFDFFAPTQPDTPCSARELWNLNLGAKAPHKLVTYLWDGLTEKDVRYANRPFMTNQWVQLEVRLDYYGPKQRQYQLWQDGELMFTVDDLGTIDKEPIFWRVGLSANRLTPSKATIFIDDVKISSTPVGHDEN